MTKRIHIDGGRAHVSQLLSRITVLLRERSEDIIHRWMVRVRGTPKIHRARALTDEELRDYTPKLLEDLIDSLARSAQPGTPGGASGPEIGSSEAAKVHVSHRIAEGY